MKKLIACLLTVCLLASLLPAAAAEEETVVFDASQMLGFRRTRDEVVRRYNEAVEAGGAARRGFSGNADGRPAADGCCQSAERSGVRGPDRQRLDL